MTKPVLDIRNLVKSFGAVQATQNVSLTLNPGEIHALIGPNGAGKSTLIAQISGALKPDAGQVWFLDQDVTALDTPQRARMGLGRSFQISATVPEFTALQNVLLCAAPDGRSQYWRNVLHDQARRDVADQLLARVGLGARRAVPASDLSHGERRQLELAMALALRPRAFLLDEPMAGLDGEGTGDIMRLLDPLRHEAPILLVEHDMDAVFALADRITVLDYGQVLATGTPDEIRSNSDVRRAYLGAET